MAAAEGSMFIHIILIGLHVYVVIFMQFYTFPKHQWVKLEHYDQQLSMK